MTATSSLKTSMRRGFAKPNESPFSPILKQEEEMFHVPLKLPVKRLIIHYLKDVLEKGGKSLMHSCHSVISAILSCREQQQIISTTFQNTSILWSLVPHERKKELQPLITSHGGSSALGFWEHQTQSLTLNTALLLACLWDWLSLGLDPVLPLMAGF